MYVCVCVYVFMYVSYTHKPDEKHKNDYKYSLIPQCKVYTSSLKFTDVLKIKPLMRTGGVGSSITGTSPSDFCDTCSGSLTLLQRSSRCILQPKMTGLTEIGVILKRDGLVRWVLWHINLCRLFNAKSIFM